MTNHPLSDQAVLTATRALIIESKRCNAKLQDETLSEEDAEYFGEYMYTLDRTLGEFEVLYQQRQSCNTDLSPFDVLYNSISLDSE